MACLERPPSPESRSSVARSAAQPYQPRWSLCSQHVYERKPVVIPSRTKAHQTAQPTRTGAATHLRVSRACRDSACRDTVAHPRMRPPADHVLCMCGPSRVSVRTDTQHRHISGYVGQSNALLRRSYAQYGRHTPIGQDCPTYAHVIEKSACQSTHLCRRQQLSADCPCAGAMACFSMP